MNYSLFIPNGAVGAYHDVTSPQFTDFTPGLPLYLSFQLTASRISGAGVATLRVELHWFNQAGGALTSFTNDTAIDASVDTLKRLTVTPPATAVRGEAYIKVTPAASPMQHDVSIKKFRLGKTELFATLGADWSTNLQSRPSNLAELTGAEGVKNALVSISASGALAGGGGGQVTIGGLGYTGALNAGTSGVLTPIGTFTTVRGNSISKSGGTHGAWQGGAVGQPQEKSLFVQSSMLDAGGGSGWYTLLALDDDATSFDPATMRFYGVYISGLGVQLVENNVLVAPTGGGYAAVPGATAASRMALVYDGTTVSLLVDGIRYLSTPAPAGLKLWPKVLDFYNSGDFGMATVDILQGPFGRGDAAERLFGGENLLDMQDWKVGGPVFDPTKQFADTVSATTGFPSSALVAGTGPFGGQEALWQCIGGTESAFDGGINRSSFDASKGFDRTKTHLYGVWVRRDQTGSYFYFGPEDTLGGQEDVETLAGVAEPNPYFFPGVYPNGGVDNAAGQNGKWYLWVGVVHGYGSGVSTYSGVAGIYDPVTGQKLASGTEFRYRSTATRSGFRCFMYPGLASTFGYLARPAVFRAESGFSVANYLGTPGAKWDTNLLSRPTNLAELAGSEALKNALVSISASGALSGAGGGQVTIAGLGYSGELNADLTRWMDGPFQSTTFKYDYLASPETGEFTRDLTFKLQTLAGQVTSGITWTYRVVSGTVNGFTSADGPKSMTGSGTGTFQVSSLGTDDATVEIKATIGSLVTVKSIPLSRAYNPPPTGGGGGGGTTTIASKSGAWTSINSSTFTTVGTLSGTLPGAVTTANLNATLNFEPAATGATANWTVELKWQRNISGTWTDVGSPAVVSGGSSVERTFEESTFYWYVTPATITNNKPNTGLTAGSANDWRLQARLVSGTQQHYVSGNASIVA